MSDARSAEIETFLRGCGWQGADMEPLAGDASSRRYFRLRRGEDPAVLMDADPANGESVGRFSRVGRWLLQKGYSAPRIFAQDATRGFLLMEDLGDALFARLVADRPGDETWLYRAATDFVADLHRQRPPAFLARADGPALAGLVALAPQWYLPGIGAEPGASADRIAPLIGTLYDGLADMAPVVSLRDFHAENLIWLDARQGPARVGLLDFQDAFVTHPAYDLVSLLQDARRDVSAQTEADCLGRYMGGKGLDQDAFLGAYALIGAQRALRILGIFARLCLRDGKPRYLEFVPRVWRYLERNLHHPALAPLAEAVQNGLPEPTAERLERIAQKCGNFRDH
jgi:N-acetylmuramate 1-kinase